MGLTNFPNGISSFGMPIVGAGEETMTTGNVFFVDSGNANAADGNAATDPNKPAATIDGCIAKCTANNGDIIFVMPGHDEDPTTSISLDVAGVWVRGLGWGDDRPTVTFGATGAAVDMSAASTRISNIIFDLGTVAATVTNCFNITAAGCIVEHCETKPHATSQFTNILTATDVADVVIRNNRFRGLHTASGTSGVVVDGCDDIQIYGNEVSGHFTEHVLDNTTPASVDEILRAFVANNYLYNYSSTAGDLVIEMDDAATGILARNVLASAVSDGFAAGFNPGNAALAENYFWDTVDQSGGLNPSASAT